MSWASRDKGARIEREIVALHRGLGVKAERVPLSGATRHRGNGADIDVYACGSEIKPLAAEVKARGNAEDFVTFERWLANADVLFLRRDRAEPIVVLPWRVWSRLLAAVGETESRPGRSAPMESR